MSELSPLPDLATGLYQHYKGGMYTVLGVARHSETQEHLVVYRPEYGERNLWVRPLSMFVELVEVQGDPVPRFRRVDALKEENPT